MESLCRCADQRVIGLEEDDSILKDGLSDEAWKVLRESERKPTNCKSIRVPHKSLANLKKENEMRLTLKKVEQAKKAIAEAVKLQEMVKTWNEAMKKIGDTGNQKVVAITIKDGRIATVCEFDETAGKPTLQGEK